MSGKRQFRIVLGNREEMLNEMYEQGIRSAYPDIDFSFAVATTVPEFIQMACDRHTDLGLFIPPGNIESDPAMPETSPEEDAVYIVRTIKATHPIPVIVIAAHPVARETVLAAGADCFLDIPAQSLDVAKAVAVLLKLQAARSPRAIKPILHHDSLHLQAAEGWLELGNHLEANEELEQIKPELRSHPDVLELRWHIYRRAKKWEACADIAGAIIRLAPDRADAWIHRSFALHELKRTQEAYDQLLRVADRYPKLWTIPYNLACYCAQLGRLEECQSWFKRAMAIDEHTVRREAIDDPDLKPLWDSMSGTLWKRT